MTELIAYVIVILVIAAISFIGGVWVGLLGRSDVSETYDRIRHPEDAAREVN